MLLLSEEVDSNLDLHDLREIMEKKTVKADIKRERDNDLWSPIFGKIDVETQKFELIKSTDDYEIRKYFPSVIAEVTYDPTHFKGNKDGGFVILANYIDAIGNPQNSTPEKITMTAPVTTQSSPEKIPMTAPVATKEVEDKEKKMMTTQFILPEKYRKAEEAPRVGEASGREGGY
ncbi:Heme-binding-like protein [Camellia lanceoleosa]|uniref:Heme-binding-like protein n=1 Tax=Camellia lanceoleosa TaxID=1840588 RepID=A0ACC0IPE2_9ERIC|nr:Heme-binding-like protein [Camellia lanceoleosa]